MGTSSGLIHHYFNSMDDVLAAAFEQAASADLAATEAAMHSCSGADERLSTFFAVVHPPRRIQLVPDVARRVGRSQTATGSRGHIASFERGLAAPDRDDDRRGDRRGSDVVRRARCDCVAGAVAARRAQHAVGSASWRDRSLSCVGLGDHGPRDRGRNTRRFAGSTDDYKTPHVQTRNMMSSPSSWIKAIGSVCSTSSQVPESISRCCSVR